MEILQLVLQAEGLDALADFYGGRLGLPIVSRSTERVSFQAGTGELTFVETPGHRPYHFAFNIPVPQFAAGKAWLAERAPLLTGPAGEDEFPFPFWDARAVYARDPAGNIFELIARDELGGPEGPFSPASLLEICEIGMVTADLDEVRRLAEESLGLPVYRNLWIDGFGALGDAHGLLIVARTGRPWWPDNEVLAQPWPLEAVLRSDGRTVRWTGPPYRALSASPR